MASDEFLKNDAFLTTELLKLAVESAGIGVWKVDPQTRSVEMTAALRQMLGVKMRGTVDYSAFFAVLHPDDQEQARKDLAGALTAPDGMCETEFRVVAPTGDVRWLFVRGQAYFDGKGEARKARLFIGTARDVTGGKAALEQQHMLLHEVNHRVKNSLQLVSSLLRLQARRIPDPAARLQLEDATARISTIAHIHQRLYRDQDIQRINFGAFLSELCADLQVSASQCSIEVSSPDFTVSTDRAISLALVVNELVTNAFKYAYPDDNPGEVRVRLKRLDGGNAELTVEDDGVGFAPNTQHKGTGLGSKIIQTMASSLHTQVEYINRRPGTAVRLVLKTANA
jgi:PAS domain S-box-containing protein